jgi:ribosome-interacting GTPase 1
MAMPTNLPPQCAELEKKYLAATTRREQIASLQELLASIPKHKGTERLCARIKTKLAKLRQEAQEERTRRQATSRTGGTFAIRRAGAAQVVILGVTGSGKSSLLTALTNARPPILGTPFSTVSPIPGMMTFEDVQIQLVEAPALFSDASKGVGWGSKVLGLARNADGLLLLLDLSRDAASQLTMMVEELDEAGILVEKGAGRVVIERKASGGVQVVCYGKLDTPVGEVRAFLRESGVTHAVVKTWGTTRLDDVVDALLHPKLYKPSIVVANKTDADGSSGRLDAVVARFPEATTIATSTLQGVGVDELPPRIFRMLGRIRVYTKRSGRRVVPKPLILDARSTVGDVAKAIHSTFRRRFKYARVWGSSNYPGERVGVHYVVQDGDTVQIRA